MVSDKISNPLKPEEREFLLGMSKFTKEEDLLEGGKRRVLYQAGKYDAMDFSINNEIVEIKTSGYDTRGFNNLNLLYSEDQFQAGKAKGFMYCVQIFINGYDRSNKLIVPSNCNSATIAGFTLFEDINKLTSIEKLFNN